MAAMQDTPNRRHLPLRPPLRKRDGHHAHVTNEELFFDLALEDLTRAAKLLRPIYDRTDGVDGWVSLEVSPLLAHDAAATVNAAKELHARANEPNLFIKIPGTREGLRAIEDAIFAAVGVELHAHEVGELLLNRRPREDVLFVQPAVGACVAREVDKQRLVFGLGLSQRRGIVGQE